MLKIHHIGSTSVEELAAKPIIDIMMEVVSLDEIDQNRDRFEAAGYVVMGEFVIPGRRYYRKGVKKRTHQIHLFESGDPNLVRHLAFRDYLREFPEIRKEYGDLKIRIASECDNDIERYCDGKDDFIKHHELNPYYACIQIVLYSRTFSMNSTLMNGLTLLQVLADAPHPHSVSELSRDSGLPKSHIHRLLQTLVESAYVEKTEDRKYRIDVGAFRLGHALLRNIPARTQFLPLMLEAVEHIGLPLTLALPFQSQAISVAHVFQDGRIRNTSETLGTVLPATSSALGKLFLAYEEPSVIEAILPTVFYDASGPNAHRTPDSLRTELEQIRNQGYSLNDEQSGPGKASVGIPILSSQGTLLAGLGASGTREDVVPSLSLRLEQLHSLVQPEAPALETIP